MGGVDDLCQLLALRGGGFSSRDLGSMLRFRAYVVGVLTGDGYHLGQILAQMERGGRLLKQVK